MLSVPTSPECRGRKLMELSAFGRMYLWPCTMVGRQRCGGGECQEDGEGRAVEWEARVPTAGRSCSCSLCCEALGLGLSFSASEAVGLDWPGACDSESSRIRSQACVAAA